MTTLYCTVHKDEDHQALLGEKYDMNTSHMVDDQFYNPASFTQAPRPNHVLWEMERDATAKFGWKFKRLYGIPA